MRILFALLLVAVTDVAIAQKRTGMISHPEAGKLTLIPGGKFLMGSPESDPQMRPDERPQHSVTVKSFYLGIHEVTYAQFRRFVSVANYRTDAERDGVGGWGYGGSKRWERPDARYNWRKTGFEQTEKHPVVNVSWNDAQAYCRWLSDKDGKRTFRLPTEAEWEYACRAGSKTIYHWGDSPNYLARRTANIADRSLLLSISDQTVKGYCSSWNDRYPFSAPVGTFKKNAFGLYDMHGNVSEWCLDFYDRDHYLLGTGKPPASGKSRVFRGGNFAHPARNARSARRSHLPPHHPWLMVGFRIATDDERP